jgi:hypothetical protein
VRSETNLNHASHVETKLRRDYEEAAAPSQRSVLGWTGLNVATTYLFRSEMKGEFLYWY